MNAITAANDDEPKAMKLANLLETVFKASSRAHEAAWELRRQHAEIERLRAENESLKQQLVQPIDMVLHCPKCGMQHIDGPEPDMGPSVDGSGDMPLWLNPPHRSHLCHGCGHIWRPADVPTNGVLAVKTKGKDDSPAQLAQRLPDRWELVSMVDAAMVEMRNIHPPLRRSECERLIRAALSAAPAQQEQPATQGEPVLVVNRSDLERMAKHSEADRSIKAFIPPASVSEIALYTRPQPASKPMPDGQIVDYYFAQQKHGESTTLEGFTEGVRFAERFHNIKD